MASQRRQLAHRRAIAGDDETFAMIEPAHDLATVVAKLALCDRLAHGHHCSTGCYSDVEKRPNS